MTVLTDEFQIDPKLCYLNHAAVAPWPRRTAQAVAAFAEENLTRGASRYLQWLQVEKDLRAQLKELINAPSVRDIALLKNTSEALSFVAEGLPWQAGDEILITGDEFPSNRIVWEALASRGVRVVEADLHQAGRSPEQNILDAITPKTKLVAVSSVQYASGIRLDLEILGSHLKSKGILFCVDAIQSIGALCCDVQRIGADFVMADGHKWMLGPEGIALFYVRAEMRDSLRILEHGWHMVENRGNYDRKDWTPANDATRFECGSPNMLGVHALNASLSLLLEVGMAEVERRVLANTAHLIRELGSIPGVRLLSPSEETRYAGIVTFRVEGVAGAQLHQALMDRGVICAHRGGGIRFSPHFYTTQETLNNAVKILCEEINALS